MQSQSSDENQFPNSYGETPANGMTPDEMQGTTSIAHDREPFEFRTDFKGFMEMYSDLQTVDQYLQQHEKWFVNCAKPMKAEPLENDGYTLTIGPFGSFGYKLEPKFSVVFESPQDGNYIMYNIPVPNYTPPGYEINYQSSMSLEEIPKEEAADGMTNVYKKKKIKELPSSITRINWELHLVAKVKFPGFIYKLKQSLIQTTGDRLLSQIIRQISPKLSYKVQENFHSQMDLPIPSKKSRTCDKISASEL